MDARAVKRWQGKRKVKEIIATLTRRGQVTVPAEVQRVLGIKPSDKLAFAIDGDQARLLPAKFTFETGHATAHVFSFAD